MGTVYLKDLIITHETPTPAPDGIITVFTVANAYIAGTLQVFLDGIRQIKDTDYTETTSTTFTMIVVPEAGENLRIAYIKA